MRDVLVGVVVGLVVAGFVGLEIWRRLGGPDKDDP